MTTPTPPIELTGTNERLTTTSAQLPDGFVDALAGMCEVVTEIGEIAEASRDWWPLALHWSLAGQVPKRAAVVARPSSTEEVSAVLAACQAAHVPVTPAGGRSGVTGASVPIFGGVLLDLTKLAGLGAVDATSGIVEVAAGTFGPELETELRETFGLTIGHFPQSFDLATVGGWVACRGAGQYSTRYGKIEDMVVGLEVVLADGTVIQTGGSPAAAVGPDLNELFVGSEGTLGVITRVWLRAHPVPAAERRAAYLFDSISAGFEACRTIMRRGATPAVLRLYDAEESTRGHGGDGSNCVLLVLDEGDAAIIDATMTVVDDACSSATRADERLVADWIADRNDTSALQEFTRIGFVVDTMEIAAPWSALDDLYEATCEALLAIPHTVAATCHLSHSYIDGACLYFTFGANPPAEDIESTYVALWDAGQRAVLANGGNLSHHHGVGLNRGRFIEEALGNAHDVLVSIKAALDPSGILNPGKLGLPSPFGSPGWPSR